MTDDMCSARLSAKQPAWSSSGSILLNTPVLLALPSLWSDKEYSALPKAGRLTPLPPASQELNPFNPLTNNTVYSSPVLIGQIYYHLMILCISVRLILSKQFNSHHFWKPITWPALHNVFCVGVLPPTFHTVIEVCPSPSTYGKHQNSSLKNINILPSSWRSASRYWVYFKWC